MVIATDIWKSYNTLSVLEGINLTIEASSIVSITGKSGTGKSTLLHILGTLDKPDKGKVLIDNVDVTILGKNELAEFRNRHIGFVFQFHHLISEFNALENVCIPGFIQKRAKKNVIEDATELLEYLGLKERLNHKPSELSGGEQQRVAIARALINKPRVIFADEPTGNLDNSTSQELHELFVRLRDELDQTFVIVTHNAELAQMSDYRMELSEGTIRVLQS